MKHPSTQIALALAVLFAAGSVAAQDSVTIYGRLDVSLDRVTVKSADGTSRTDHGLSNDGSRLGFRGSEDLGDGLRANFNIEQGFSPVSGTLTQGGLIWGRTSWVGLSSKSFGEIRLGRNYIPLDDMAWPIDPFYHGGVGAMWTLLPYTSRINGSAKYISPRLGPIQFQGLVSDGAAGNGGRQYGMSAAYNEKAADLHFAYTLAKNAVAAGDRKEMLLGGAWKFGSSRAVAEYFQRDDDGATNKLVTTMIGGNLSVGIGELRASYTRLKQGAESTKRLAVGYWYPVSKRTFLSAGVARQNNSAGLRNNVNPAFPTLVNGDDVTAWQLGLRHNF